MSELPTGGAVPVRAAGPGDVVSPGVVPLSEAGVGTSLEVVEVVGVGRARLREMGMCEGVEVKVLATGRNLVCLVCGTRLALSRALASEVRVRVGVGGGDGVELDGLGRGGLGVAAAAAS